MKNHLTLFSVFLFSLALTVSGPVEAQHNKKDKKNNHAKEKSKAQLAHIEAPQKTSGSITADGNQINYDAIVGTLPILNDKETDTTAKMSFTAYVKKGVDDKETRPVTFVYNGGPGSATMWLHMGSFGPKRVVTEDTEHLGGAPYDLTDNKYSLLDVTDLVFIDAPGTGFGRILHDHNDDYYGVDEDGEAFGKFVDRYITKYNRWNSPKFLFGESYGTTRSAVLSKELQNKHSIDLNGVILLSQILNFGLSIDGPAQNPGNDLPYQLGLPTYAATAYFHDKLPDKPDNLEDFLDEVEDFAMDEYALALGKGQKLDEETFDEIADKLHSYTGLSTSYIKKANLRVDGGEFEQELLNDDEKATGRLDTRYTGPILDPLAQRSFYDPQSSAVSSAYVSLFNDYVRDQLDYGKDMTYRPNIYGEDVDWNWDRKGGRYGGGNKRTAVNVMPDLAQTMKKNPKLNVMFLSGYYDLATPFYEGVYELEHLPMPNSLMDNIKYHFYESGHMVYLHEPSLDKMHDDVKEFIDDNS